MAAVLKWGGMALTLLCVTSSLGVAQTVHEIRMEVDPDQEQFTFSPASITARPGDALLFKVVNGAPHSIVFEAAGLSAPARQALNSALTRRSADLTSPLLTDNGSEYRLTVPSLPPGTYRFFCLPHRAYDERGELHIK